MIAETLQLLKLTQILNPWLDATMPERQYQSCVARELKEFREGKPVLPYTAVVNCLKRLPKMEHPTLLDVGASSGFYSEVLKIAGFNCCYVALNFSPAFKTLAERLYPGIDFRLGDARELPFADDSFDIVLSGCCLLHIAEYEAVILETARVASRYVIFSKTPVHAKPTEFFEKHLYGLPHCLEIRFNEEELMGLFERYGLRLIHTEPAGTGHKTFLLRKLSLSECEWERA